MDLNKLKKSVYEANMELKESGLVLFTFGNVSMVDRERRLLVIKPSGVSYDALAPENMVCVSLESGQGIDSDLNPSSDTPTHLELYRAFESCGGIVHSHSEYATACAQANIPIRCMGTTHADYFYGEIPCTRKLTKEEIDKDYELNTGKVIAERFKELDYKALPGVLVNGHAPFTWGNDPEEAVHNAVVMEEVAKMALRTEMLGNTNPVDNYLLDKHYLRKHGKDAYYGQINTPSDGKR